MLGLLHQNKVKAHATTRLVVSKSLELPPLPKLLPTSFPKSAFQNHSASFLFPLSLKPNHRLLTLPELTFTFPQHTRYGKSNQKRQLPSSTDPPRKKRLKQKPEVLTQCAWTISTAGRADTTSGWAAKSGSSPVCTVRSPPSLPQTRDPNKRTRKQTTSIFGTTWGIRATHARHVPRKSSRSRYSTLLFTDKKGRTSLGLPRCNGNSTLSERVPPATKGGRPTGRDRLSSLFGPGRRSEPRSGVWQASWPDREPNMPETLGLHRHRS